MFLRIVLISALFHLSGTVSSSIVITTGGPVRGKLNQWHGFKYYSYEGIPYAENPTSKLRFKPPVPRKPWAHILDATEEGPICSQATLVYDMYETQEDCLIINVYTPANTSDTLLPVVVFFHGGALLFSSGRVKNGLGPELLLQRGIVYVTMNYRLGPFGFLSLDIEEASGNAGLKDVLLSLKWVQQNIDRFGGDPNKITIAGHSAGAVICNYLLLTNQSDGLFHQALILSGSAFTPRSFAKHPKESTLMLARELGIQTDDVNKILESLQEKDDFDILMANKRIDKRLKIPFRRYAPFVPTKEIRYKDALFPEDPIETFRKSDSIPQNVPVLVSITEEEAKGMIKALSLFDPAKIDELRENPEIFVPSDIEYPIESQLSKELTRDICNTYFGGEDMRNLNITTLLEYISDTQYIHGVHYWITRYKNMIGSNNLYFYIFDFIGDFNRTNILPNFTVNASGHGDDMPYFFVTNSYEHLKDHLHETTKRMMKTMLSLVSNFIYYGNPTPANLNNDLIWPDYGKEQNYLRLKENPTIEKFNTSKFFKRMQFWDKVYDEYYNYVDNGGEIEKKIIP